jgi:hypothetical protein
VCSSCAAPQQGSGEHEPPPNAWQFTGSCILCCRSEWLHPDNSALYPAINHSTAQQHKVDHAFLRRMLADREPEDPAQPPTPGDMEASPAAETRSSEQQTCKVEVPQRWVHVCAWLQPAGGRSLVLCLLVDQARCTVLMR